MSANLPSIVVSGASGMLGTALRSELSARRVALVQLVRTEPITEGQLQWNPVRRPPMTRTVALEACNAAIHLSGASVAGHRWTAAYRRELISNRVDSTRTLASTLAGLRRPPQTLLVASAVGIYGNRGNDILTEASPAGEGFLAELCMRWETATDPAEEAGIRVAHLRFGVVLGPRRGALGQMLPMFRLGLGGKLGRGSQWMSWISLSDAIRAILYVLDTPTLSGPVNVTSPDPVTNAEFTRSLARQLGRPAYLAMPEFALRLAFGDMADETLLASTRVIPEKLKAAGFQFEHPSIDQALAVALQATPVLSR